MSMTIADIARLAGVSRATVSGVLNNNPTVSAKTKKRIAEIIEQHNFRPNEVARALALQHTALIALVIKDVSNPFYSKISLGVEQVCAEQGYSVIIGNSQQDVAREIDYLGLLERKRVDGMIILPLQAHEDYSLFKNLQKAGYPLVLLAEIPGIKTDLVRVDDEKGAYNATRHLLKLGRRNVVFVSGPETALASQRRLAGFQKAFEVEGMDFSARNIVAGGWRYQDGYNAGKKMFEQLLFVPDGVLCYNDSVAIGFIRALTEKGFRVPEIAVIGFDDAGAGAYLPTALTTVAQPAIQIGRLAALVLFRRIKNRTKKIEKIILDTELVVRESCGAHLTVPVEN
ncbi:LacI family DNA-binding transcriptional regulator [candidate division KSB1 bacterium]|nr:LacI family DNA-binding transcriptional regulator [candidate division KSB1 bacterium]